MVAASVTVLGASTTCAPDAPAKLGVRCVCVLRSEEEEDLPLFETEAARTQRPVWNWTCALAPLALGGVLEFRVFSGDELLGKASLPLCDEPAEGSEEELQLDRGGAAAGALRVLLRGVGRAPASASTDAGGAARPARPARPASAARAPAAAATLGAGRQVGFGRGLRPQSARAAPKAAAVAAATPSGARGASSRGAAGGRASSSRAAAAGPGSPARPPAPRRSPAPQPLGAGSAAAAPEGAGAAAQAAAAGAAEAGGAGVEASQRLYRRWKEEDQPNAEKKRQEVWAEEDRRRQPQLSAGSREILSESNAMARSQALQERLEAGNVHERLHADASKMCSRISESRRRQEEKRTFNIGFVSDGSKKIFADRSNEEALDADVYRRLYTDAERRQKLEKQEPLDGETYTFRPDIGAESDEFQLELAKRLVPWEKRRKILVKKWKAKNESALQEKQEREDELYKACTFRPSINQKPRPQGPTARSLSARRQVDRGDGGEEGAEADACTFQPQLCPGTVAWAIHAPGRPLERLLSARVVALSQPLPTSFDDFPPSPCAFDDLPPSPQRGAAAAARGEAAARAAPAPASPSKSSPASPCKAGLSARRASRPVLPETPAGVRDGPLLQVPAGSKGPPRSLASVSTVTPRSEGRYSAWGAESGTSGGSPASATSFAWPGRAANTLTYDGRFQDVLALVA